MMKRHIRLMTILILVLISTFPVIVIANSMEPPGTVLIIEGKATSIDAWIEKGEDEIHGRRIQYPLETQYWFDAFDTYYNADDITIVVKVDNEIGEFSLRQFTQYHNTYTYNIKSGLLIEGKSEIRSIILVMLRVLLTLIIEGIIFYLFGFRNRKSWMLFIIINLITQISLNIYINNLEVAVSYPLIILIVSELWVFIAEIISFSIIVTENRIGRRIGYAVVANLVSLVLGGLLLTLLPI